MKKNFISGIKGEIKNVTKIQDFSLAQRNIIYKIEENVRLLRMKNKDISTRPGIVPRLSLLSSSETLLR
jgi:hypothetical protein